MKNIDAQQQLTVLLPLNTGCAPFWKATTLEDGKDKVAIEQRKTKE